MKNLRAQFNQNWISGLLLHNNTTTMYAGKYAAIELGLNGTNIQAGPGNAIFLNGTVKGPGYVSSNIPMDYVPTFFNQTPRKSFDLSVITEIARTSIETMVFLSLGL